MFKEYNEKDDFFSSSKPSTSQNTDASLPLIQLKEIEYINFNKEYFYDIKNNKKEVKENEINEFTDLTTTEIRININNLKIELAEYEKTNYKSIQNKTMINLLLQKIKNFEIELIKRQEN